MAGNGEVYIRHDRKWAFRVRAENGQIIADDANQGYENRLEAIKICEKLIIGGYEHEGRAESYQRHDGAWGFRIVDTNTQIIAGDANQSYEKHAEAQLIADHLISGQYAGPVAEVSE